MNVFFSAELRDFEGGFSVNVFFQTLWTLSRYLSCYSSLERLDMLHQTNVDLKYFMQKTIFPILLPSRVSEIKIFLFFPLLVNFLLAHIHFSQLYNVG